MDGQTSKNGKAFDQNQNFHLRDSRYLPRWEVNNRVFFRAEEDKHVYEGLSRDISCAGACLMLPEVFQVGQKVQLTIFLSENVSVDVEGKILWSKQCEDGNLIGIDFSETNQKAKEMILKYAFEVKKDDIVKHWFNGWN